MNLASIKQLLRVPKPVAIVLLVSLFVRLLIAAVVGAGFDEAYYYVYWLNPDLSYFDHPPVVALLAGIGPTITGVASPLTIRLGSILLFVVTGLLLYRLALRFVGPDEAFFAMLVFNCCPMTILGAGAAILPDAGMAFFWVAALLVLERILHDSEKSTPVDWIIAGALSGAAMLSKYHGFLLPGMFGLYLLVYRRDLLRKPWPYVYGVVALIVFSPVIIWNIQNDFISFRFQGGRAVGSGLSLGSFFQGIGGQIGYLTPMIFVPMAVVIWRSIRDGVRGSDRSNRFWFFFGSAPVLLFLLIAIMKPILPHWTLAGYLLLMIPLGGMLSAWWSRGRAARAGIVGSIVLIAILLGVLAAHSRIGILASVVPTKGDITIDTVGWDVVSDYLDEKKLSPDDVFLFSHKWFMSGEITLATGGVYDVMCFNSNDGRGYSVWDRKLDQLGRDGIYICTDRHSADPNKRYGDYFESIGEPEVVAVERGGAVVKKTYLYRCSNLKKRYPTSPQ